MKDLNELEKYIQTLESLVCFYASCYEKANHEYKGKHLETCSVMNPARRELTEQEKDEFSRFPQIQGSRMVFTTKSLSKFKVKNKLPITDVLQVIQRKYS